MSTIAISGLPDSAGITGAELVPLVQSGATVKCRVDFLVTGLPTATTSGNGLMSAADKTILDDATDTNSASSLVKRNGAGSASFTQILATTSATINSVILDSISGGELRINGSLRVTSGVTLLSGFFAIGSCVIASGGLSVGTSISSATANVAGAIVCGNFSTTGNVGASGFIGGAGDVYSSGAGATKIGILNPAGASAGQTFVGLRYDALNNRAELGALEGGVAWRDVLIASGGAYAMFGHYTSVGGLTIIGHLDVKDASGNIRQLAVVS